MDRRLELGVTRLGPLAFRRQMEALAKRGCRTLGSDELLGLLTKGGEDATGRPSVVPTPPDRPPLVLTFDDGYEALARHAFPVLADLGFRALVFVITDHVGGENVWDVQYGWRRFRHLSWDDLAYWQERGIEVHSHGATHARLTWISDDAARDELVRSHGTIAARLGRAPTAICYPFGAADARVRSLAAAAGYAIGFTGPNGLQGGPRPGTAGPDPLGLRRLPVYAWDAFAHPWVLRAGLRGRMARGAARATSRVSVGTSLIQRLLGRRYGTP